MPVSGDHAGTLESNASLLPNILVTTTSQRKVLNSLVVSNLTTEENIDVNKNYWEGHDSSPSNVVHKTFGMMSDSPTQHEIVEVSQEHSHNHSPDVDLHSGNESNTSMDKPGHGQSMQSLINMHTAGADTLDPATLMLLKKKKSSGRSKKRIRTLQPTNSGRNVKKKRNPSQFVIKSENQPKVSRFHDYRTSESRHTMHETRTSKMNTNTESSQVDSPEETIADTIAAKIRTNDDSPMSNQRLETPEYCDDSDRDKISGIDASQKSSVYMNVPLVNTRKGLTGDQIPHGQSRATNDPGRISFKISSANHSNA